MGIAYHFTLNKRNYELLLVIIKTHFLLNKFCNNVIWFSTDEDEQDKYCHSLLLVHSIL